ncbi:MAG: S9 family peptidase, partial [Algicola sp.]|nr:S9 family peptidase [Algicola sp.]
DSIMITTQDGYGTYGTRRLRKMNIYNGRITPGERSSIRRATFVVDRKGTPIIQWGADEEGENIVTYRDKDGQWESLPNAKDYQNAWQSDEQHVILKRDAGNNVYELVDFDAITHKITVLATSANADMSPILDKDEKIIGYRTEKDGKPVEIYFDEQSEEAQFRRLIERTFKTAKTSVYSSNKDGSRRMISVWSDQEPGKHYLYDANSKTKLRLLAASKQKIKRNRFAKMKPIKFTARDGLELHGYISQPVGSTGNDPMVLRVHGGPFGPRDNWGWNREVQLLTSNGYAVLQVNFRGSGGYGEQFEESGHLQWGKAMQDDLTDGVAWAVKNGYANKDKLCIYGGSYGGYAALMGVVKNPDLYKCAIGYIGVYDLNIMAEVGDIPETKEGIHFVETTIGKKDAPDTIKNSPSRNASKIKAGIFLVHGKQDNRAPMEHYEAMSEALDKIGKPYEKMIADGEGHGFSENENQYKLYGKMLTFLAKYLK